MVMGRENVTNDVDEEVYGNNGAERHEAQEPSAVDRRAIADADQAGQLDISGETRTARTLRTPEPPTDAASRHAGFVLSRFTVRPDGRNPSQHLLGTPYASPLCIFGESVFALMPDLDVRAAKLTNRWISGCWW